MFKKEKKIGNFGKIYMIILISVLLFNLNTVNAQVPAFPEAEGFGAFSIGGRGGRIIEVINLNDSGPGSLREAIQATGPRIIIFKVAGYIDLESPIRLVNPYVTIAGQTAPGDGICLRMKPGNSEGIRGLIYVPNSADNLHDVIIRYLKFRQGWSLTYKNNGGPRPLNVYFRRGYDVIVDHISSQWTRDNLFTISLSSEAEIADSIYNFSIQNSLFGESEEGHSTGMNIQGGSNASIGECYYTGNLVKDVSVHKNLFTGTDHRNPRVNTNKVKVINNVIYNWGNRVGESAHNVKVDFINNYYKAGPQTTDNIYYQRLLHEEWGDDCELGSIYMSGNIMAPHHLTPSDPYEFYQMSKTGYPLLENKYKRYALLEKAEKPVKILSVYDAYDTVLEDVGDNARLDDNGNLIRNSDSIDLRMINDVKNGTGFDHEINESDWNNGIVSFPVMDSGVTYIDSDNDGMADEWEMNKFGDLNTAKYDDTNKTDNDSDGYYDLEEFLNGSDPTVPYGIRADVNQDSFVDSLDYMLVLKNSLDFDMSGTNWYSSTITGDVNCDNLSNSTDAMLILRKSLGLDMSGTHWCVQ